MCTGRVTSKARKALLFLFLCHIHRSPCATVARNSNATTKDVIYYKTLAKAPHGIEGR